MQNIFETVFYFIGIVIVLILFRYRSKKFSFVNAKKVKDYPVIRYKIGNLIIVVWISMLLFGIFQKLVFQEILNSKIFFIPVLATIFYGLFGAVPEIRKSKDEIKVELDIINIGLVGLDWLGSWVGEYDKGLIIYSYFIDYSSIKLCKKSKDKIIFSGVEKNENIPINVTLKSKKSINYIYPLLNDFSVSN